MGRTDVLDLAELFDWLARQPQRNGVVVECGGSEVADVLAWRFPTAISLDIGPTRVSRRVPSQLNAQAEALPLAADSVDLLVSAQTLHHFSVPPHLAEARRVLRPGGVFAALRWGALQLPADLEDLYGEFFEAVEPFWEPHREWVISGYPDVDFCGTPIELPPIVVTRNASLAVLEAHLVRWSSTQAALRADVDIPDPPLTGALRRRFATFEMRWPIRGQVYRVDKSDNGPPGSGP